MEKVSSVKEAPKEDGSSLQWISQAKMHELEENKLVQIVVDKGAESHRVIITAYGNEIRAFDYTQRVNPGKGGLTEWVLTGTYGLGPVTGLEKMNNARVALRLANATLDNGLTGSVLGGLNLVITGLTMVPGGASADAILRRDYVDATVSFVGDVAFFSGCLIRSGAKAAALARGANASVKLAEANKALVRLRAVEGTIAVVRMGQAGYAIVVDEKGKAAAYIGEAILRIIGVTYIRKVAVTQRTIPQGLTEAQFNEAAALIRAKAGHIEGEVVVQGSRAAGTAKATSDIDFAIRVSPEQFDALVKARFGTPNPGSAKFRTMQHAIETGKIQAGEAGLRRLRVELEGKLGMEVDISIIRQGGPFDNPPFVPVPKPGG